MPKAPGEISEYSGNLICYSVLILIFVSLPTTTETLQLYAKFSSRTFKSTDSIRNYINGVKSMHLLLGYSVEHINGFNRKIKSIL